MLLAIYTRLSQDDVDSNSISNQKREGIAFAKKEKLPHKVYNEGKGVSGRNEIEDRPVLYQLMKDISSKEITHVWFRNQNRLERSSNTFHIFANLVKKNNIKVYINDKLEDWSNPNSFLQSSILTALNEYQASLQSYQTKKVLLDNVKEGKSFGIYPYGYKSENGFLVIDEDEKKVVEKIYDLSLNGMGTRSIAELFNNENITTRYNKIGKGKLTVKNRHSGIERTIEKKDIKWSGNSVRGIIVNTIYKGKRKWKDKYYDAPAIFDEEYWQKVNDNLKNNSNNKGKKVEHKYLLKGLLRCDKCGRNMYGRSRVSKKDHYYQCSSKRIKNGSCGNRSINIDKIENFVWSRFFKGDDLLELLKKDLIKEDNQLEELENNIDKHNIEVTALNSEYERLVNLHIKGNIKEDVYLKMSKQIDDKIKNSKKYIKDYKKQIANAKNSKLLIDQYIKEFDSYTDKLSFIQKKEVVNKYFKDIIIKNDDNSIHNYFIKFVFKINIKPESYFFTTRSGTSYSITENQFFSSKYLDPNIELPYQEVDNKIIESVYKSFDGNVYTLPYLRVENDKFHIIKNTIFPHGDVESWTIIKIVNFYKKNPKWFCRDSGVSVFSLDKKLKGYKVISKEYQKFKKKNESIKDWFNYFLDNRAFNKS